MHLTVVCPACQSQYQVDPNLRGKRMRCPNSICRTVFEINDPATAPPTPTPAPPVPPRAAPEPPRKPVPVAKPVAPPPPAPEPPPPPKWSAPPPVRAAGLVREAQPQTAPVAVHDLDIPGDGPDEFPGDDPVPVPTTPSAATVTPPPAAAKRRRSLWIIGAAVMILAVAGAMLVQRLDLASREQEQARALQADEAYAADEFDRSKEFYQSLQRDYPASKNLPRYRVRAILSELRAEAAADDPETLDEARAHVLDFLDSSGNSPEFKAFRDDIDHLTRRMTQRLVKRAQGSLDSAHRTQAEEMAKWSPDGVGPHRKILADIRAAAAAKTLRERLVNDLAQEKQFPTTAGILRLGERIRAAGLADDAEMTKLVLDIKSALRDSIARKPPEPAPRDAVDNSGCSTFLALPALPVAPGRGDEPVVALSPTGVLYALKPRTGELAWATRLGIDSRIPPRRWGDGWIVVSNDAKTVALLDGATGQRIWTYSLTAPAAGEPILAPGHLLVPLVTGRLDDLNPDNGSSLGFYFFDQPLPHGGVVHPGTPLVSLPGREACVYVVDLTSGTCAAVLETGHAAGSLVGPPLFIPEEQRKNEPRGWIVLALAEPGPRIRIRPIPYPTDGRSANDLPVPGSLGSLPYHDAESLLLATQEGRLHSIGLKLPGTSDPLLFPLRPADVALESPPAGETSRARIVHVDADTLWIVSAGRLQRLNKSFSPKTGPALTARWPQAIALGEPFAAHAHVDAAGTTLFVATHDPHGPGAWMTAVDGETGKILWKTQLGSTPRGDPMLLGPSIVWDDGHGLCRVPLPKAGACDLEASYHPFPGPARLASVLLPGEPNVRVAWAPGQPKLTFAEVDDSVAALREVALPAAVAGPPVVLGRSLIVPLTSGVLARVDLANGSAVSGPDWRASGAPADAAATLIAVGPDRFVTTNGKGGLTLFEWAKTWKELTRHADGRALTGPPLATPAGIVIAEDGKLVLLDPATLRLLKSWKLDGQATSPPQVAAGGVAVVVDHKRVLTIDPAKDGVQNDRAFLADVVAVTAVKDGLLVADSNGNLWPPTGEGLSLTANLVPAARPLMLPDGRLFIIWSDGVLGVVAMPKSAGATSP